MHTASLREFIELAPVCSQTTTVMTVLELFKQGSCDRVAVVNDQNVPVGLVRLQRLVAYSLEAGSSLNDWKLTNAGTVTTAEHRGPNTPFQEVPFQEGTSANLQQSLHPWTHLSVKNIQPCVEPISTVPIFWSLKQFQPLLQAFEQNQWALVDAAGKYLGVLNLPRLWQFLAMHPNPPERSPTGQVHHHANGGTPKPEESEPDRQPHPPLHSLSPLIELLERLPLPLMLQTRSGRVVTQNLFWREQIGGLQDPGWIRQEAAAILEAHSRSSTSDGEQPPTPEGESRFTTEPYLALSQRSAVEKGDRPAGENPVTPPALAACRLGTDGNSCICVCPMNDGQERVWQFIKIPLETIAYYPPATPDIAFQNAALAETSTSQPALASQFQLAKLREQAGPICALEEVGPAHASQAEPLWLILAQDMTEQQQVAKELAAKNADLVQLNRLKDEFLACISHELKTPLTAVLGLSSLLKDQALGALNPRQVRYAQLIHQSGRHLISIVNDILDLTRIETGQLDLKLESVKIKTVCDRAYAQARRWAAEDEDKTAPESAMQKLPQFSLKIQPELDTLIVDELRLRQMLANLLSNALKFTDSSGEIGLMAESWEGWIAFTVWDTGIGIPADKQHLVFQKFQQLENPLTRRFEGTGLGLVITQKLARLHGGDVTFTSVEGQGSQFTLLLPPTPPQSFGDVAYEAPEQMPAFVPTASSSRIVLVVEAVPRFLEDLARQLGELGYRVVIARSGTEALEKVRRLQPALVCLNPLIPLLSGWDVLTLLKSNPETRHVPVVVTATRVEKSQAYQSGADGFLSLPVQAEALQKMLESLLKTPKLVQQQDLLAKLTVLHLHGGHIDPERYGAATGTSHGTENAIADLNSVLHPYPCRVLEVDDLEQADLLARVWKPDVILLDGHIPKPLAYLKQLSRCPYLASLPLVTLTPETTQAANQVAGLAVFPCLAPLSHSSETEAGQAELSALLQVMQVASGMGWAPHVLAVDLSELQAGDAAALDLNNETTRFSGADSSTETLPAGSDSGISRQRDDWLHATVQYIQTAGFRSSVAHSWLEVLQKLRHQSADLLLICARHTRFQPEFLSALQALDQLDLKPPVLVWDYQPCTDADADQQTQNSETLLRAIATKILPPSLSMHELLEQIRQTLNA